MWNDDFAPVCRNYPELVAVYESPDRELALLLRHSLVPLPEERSRWFHDTRRAAREVLRALHGAGFEGDMTILQWRPVAEVAVALRRWRCRYDADPLRRAELADTAQACLADDEMLDTPPPSDQPVDEAARALEGLRHISKDNVLEWYRNMSTCWLAAEPPTRRRLILRTHRWIAERVLGPISRGAEPATGDLRPDGTLSWLLVRMVPNGKLPVWKPWIRLLLADLRRALSWPPASRDAAWRRWLFLIPYGINVGRVPEPNAVLAPPMVDSVPAKPSRSSIGK